MKKLILILFLPTVFLLWNLGGTYLTNWDEAWYAGISRNMFLRGNYIIPYWNNAPYFDKGPLYHWLSVFAFKIIPNWETAARLPSALAGIGCVILTYFLGKHLFSQKVGLVSSLVLASTVGFLFRSRTGNLDSLMVFLILASFLSFFLAEKDPRYFLTLGASLGLIFLTKTAFILYPLLIFILLTGFERKLKHFKSYFFLGGLILAIVIPGTWLLLGLKQAGKPFFDFYFNILFWPISKVAGSTREPLRFSPNYFYYLFYGTKLWFFFFLPAFLFSSLKIFRDKRFFFLASAFIPYFLVLLATKEAGDWYLFPLYPMVAIIVGVFLVWLQEKLYPQKQGAFFLVSLCFSLALIQNLYFQSLFILPESIRNEVELSKMAKNLTNKDETIIVDDYYFPVASFYSERKIRVVRREATDTALALSKEGFYKLLLEKERLVILTTTEKFFEIKKDLGKINFKIEGQIDGHLLVTKI